MTKLVDKFNSQLLNVNSTRASNSVRPWRVGEVVVGLAVLAVWPVAVALAVHALPTAAGLLVQLLVEPAAV